MLIEQGSQASAPILKKHILMRAFAAENNLRDLVGRGGKHHEIYLGDALKAAPSKHKTVLQHPVEELVKCMFGHV